jgi:aminoglycoside phosphotransferase (APT) family kinase protein
MLKMDQAAAIRQGEELDLKRVEVFLRDALPALEGPVLLKQFPSGHSNLTYLVTVGAQEMVLRRPPFGTKARGAHDMVREYRILAALREVFPYVPRPLALCQDPAILGAPFYVMERIKGLIPRRELPEAIARDAAAVRRLFERFVDILVELHGLDYQRLGLGDLGKPQGYARRQVEGWSERYRRARTPDAPEGEDVMRWLADHVPPDTSRPAIIHNDFKFDNLVLDPEDPSRIIGVLDWEMSTIGDPALDLGCTLGYWVERDDPPELQLVRTLPTHVPGAMTRRNMVERYAALTGRVIEPFDFYYVFGLFRLAVIAQQIYYRYYQGQTRDERFKLLIGAVQVLEQTARRVIAAADA